jgi:energy-coupling factor transport system permease protein
MAIEFSRNITFGQYLDLRSPVHRLDPRTKLLATALLMAAVLLTRSLAGLGVLALLAAIIQLRARIPLSYTLRGMRLLVATMLIIFVFQVLFFPSPSPERTWWQWWVFSISTDGIMQATRLLVQVILLYYFTTTLMFVTPMMDLADGVEIMLDPLKKVGVPVNELVMTMIVALKFVPLLIAELERLVKAQAARGNPYDTGGFIQRGRRVGGLLIPLFVNALNRAEVLTTAMNARCYRGGKGRTKRRVLTMRYADLRALALVFCFAVAAVVVGRLVAI